MVPVVRDADALSIHGLNRAINEVAARTRTGKLKARTSAGARSPWTTPAGPARSDAAHPQRPGGRDPDHGGHRQAARGHRVAAGDSIAIRPMMAMVLGFDHRATDGAQAGRFLTDVKRWLESVDDQTPIW